MGDSTSLGPQLVPDALHTFSPLTIPAPALWAILKGCGVGGQSHSVDPSPFLSMTHDPKKPLIINVGEFIICKSGKWIDCWLHWGGCGLSNLLPKAVYFDE